MSENKARVCVPVRVRRAAELPGAVARAAEVADVVELRLDYLEENQLAPALQQLGELRRAHTRPFIYTLRPSEQGGARQLTHEERVAFWMNLFQNTRAALVEETDFADLELDLLESPSGPSLLDAAGRLKIICSFHDFAGLTADPEQLAERMTKTRAAVLKIALRVREVTGSLKLFRLLERARRDGRELIAVAMDEAGIVTRVLGPSRGGFLTYASLDAASATAPGQLDARELLELYRVRSLSMETHIHGLAGRPVAHSLSPRIHNAAFKALGLDAVYLPFDVGEVGEFVRRMIHPRTRELSWNLRGLSVTAPHKRAVIEHLDRVAPSAREIGAVNTVVVEGEELHGYNTDADAALAPLSGVVELEGARVALIGAGGAARALLWSLRARGAHTTLFARDAARASETAEEFGARASQLRDASFDNYELVINATPLGTRGRQEGETPADAAQLRGARLVYDLVYNPAETRLLREARAAGCETVGGLSMLVAQAAAQFRLWTGREAPLEVMRAAAEKQMSVKN
ncbi:MAG TPA: shikimate dehydrogenase [Pyrinomonadaceae bacterium]|nr:shikimate dehydrogenase [Pyrinomonadaceae bacterium]